MANLTVTTENLNTLTSFDQLVVRETAKAEHSSLDAAEQWLRAQFSNWFVYRGGNHVALHRVSGGERVLLVAERRNEEEVFKATPVAAPIEAGDAYDVESNQAVREGQVLAVIGGEWLVEYEMPKGTTALRLCSDDNRNGKTVSYHTLSRAWLQAVVDGGYSWLGRSQGRHVPTAQALLDAKNTVVAQAVCRHCDRRITRSSAKAKWCVMFSNTDRSAAVCSERSGRKGNGHQPY